MKKIKNQTHLMVIIIITI